MTSLSGALAVAALVVAAGAAVWDVSRDQRATIVVYTTPALRDLLEKDIFPLFFETTGYPVAPVYVAAGQQFNRLRMSGDDPEAHVFLHASPLYLEKGFAERRILATRMGVDASLNASFMSAEAAGGRHWRAFAWSPLVEVHASGTPAPDLATLEGKFGFPHPLLSNNGVWVVLFLEGVDDDVGQRLLSLTRVQPTNSRANIGGVADGSFGMTLGYEAVARYYQTQGARVDFAVPVIHGERVTMPILFSASLIDGEHNPRADALVEFLFSDAAQARLAKHHFRPVLDGAADPQGAIDVSSPDIRTVQVDWSQWETVEAKLSEYEVKI